MHKDVTVVFIDGYDTLVCPPHFVEKLMRASADEIETWYDESLLDPDCPSSPYDDVAERLVSGRSYCEEYGEPFAVTMPLSELMFNVIRDCEYGGWGWPYYVDANGTIKQFNQDNFNEFMTLYWAFYWTPLESLADENA